MSEKKIYSYNTYECVKCKHTKYIKREARVSDSFLSALLNWQTEKFTTYICKNCGYTEFYSKSNSLGQDIAEITLGT